MVSFYYFFDIICLTIVKSNDTFSLITYDGVVDCFISFRLIYKGQERVAEILIQNGANVSATANGEWTSLHIAAMNGKTAYSN